MRRFALCMLACSWGGALVQAADRPPNIIFLMSDQQPWDCIGRLNPLVKTPALDRIAAEGIVFDQGHWRLAQPHGLALTSPTQEAAGESSRPTGTLTAPAGPRVLGDGR